MSKRKLHHPEFKAEASSQALTGVAIRRLGPPEIMNADPGYRFTSIARTDRLRRSTIRISMDGKGRVLDKIFVERRWRSVK